MGGGHPHGDRGARIVSPATLIALLQAAAEPVVTDPATQTSPWSPTLIAALFTGIASVLVALTGMIAAIMTMRRENAAAAAASAAATSQVHNLVNSANSMLLEQIARLSRRVAVATGAPEDAAEASAAEHNSDEKAKITVAATAKKEAADAAALEKK